MKKLLLAGLFVVFSSSCFAQMGICESLGGPYVEYDEGALVTCIATSDGFQTTDYIFYNGDEPDNSPYDPLNGPFEFMAYQQFEGPTYVGIEDYWQGPEGVVDVIIFYTSF